MKLDGQHLSNDFLKVITQDLKVKFGQTMPSWKYNSMRNTMEQVSIVEIGYDALIN